MTPRSRIARDGAIAGGVDVGEAGTHSLVHHDRSPDAGLGAGGHEQARVGPNSHRHQDQVGEEGTAVALGVGPLDGDPPAAP